MFAPDEAGQEPVKEPAPTPPKRRTITLTHRAPISIVEDQWPIIAQGSDGNEHLGAPWSWAMAIRVRREKEKLHPNGRLRYGGGRVIIHAKYSYWDESDEEAGQRVRVGRLLTAHEAASDLWKHIQEIGEELRGRIGCAAHQLLVTGMVDRCFETLTPFEDY